VDSPVLEPTKVSLVVPTFQERDNIAPLLAAVCPALGAWDHELIFVDDDSSDGTSQAIQDAAEIDRRIRLIVRHGERGLAGAVIRGFEEATGNVLGSINADLSHDASIIPALIRAIEGGAELAVGSRRVPGGGFGKWPWYRRLASDVATAATKWFLKVPLSDPMSGFYFLRRSVFERSEHDLQGLGFKVMLELAAIGVPATISEVPYVFRNRQRGSSKMSPTVIVQFLRMLWRLRRRARQSGRSAGDTVPASPREAGCS
jgi:dolichol-phosphate mannosyltransferase